MDCTVLYAHPTDSIGSIASIDAIANILGAIETIIIEAYGSRKKISLQLTREISQSLKRWADIYAKELNVQVQDSSTSAQAIGACHALAVYYYAIGILTKPFLLYEAYRAFSGPNTNVVNNPASIGRRALADACVDAACKLADMVVELVRTGIMPHKMPFIVYVNTCMCFAQD